MDKHKTTTSKAVFSEVLADAAYLFVDDGPPEPAAEDAWLQTRIGYRGPCQGELLLQCPRAFATLVAANLLGIDSADGSAESKSEDAVNELMNITCGQFVTKMYGPDDVFDLTIPATRQLDVPPDYSSGDDPGTATLTVKGYPVRIIHRAIGDADACCEQSDNTQRTE